MRDLEGFRMLTSPANGEKEERRMDIEKEDVRKLLEDPAFAEAVVSAVLADKDAVEELAEEVADALGDALEDDPRWKEKILSDALENPSFREKVTRALVEEISD